MKEFNNRKIADKFAEYITGDELRRYVAKKVRRRRIEDKLDKFIYETFKVPSTQEISDKEQEQLTLF